MRSLLFSFIFISLSLPDACLAQGVQEFDTTQGPGVDSKRLTFVIGGEVVITAGTMIALNSVWYKDFPRTSFHSFDDTKEWLQMDKCGHVVTSFYISKISIDLAKNCGLPYKKAALFGLWGIAYQSGLEILDGYSSGWGFSWSDMGANVGGTALCMGQEFLWHQQRINLKVSYHDTYFPNYRPEELGSSEGQRIFKDYNGQTYWLTANISSFIKKENKFPKWLDLALGYGATGMTGGSSNPLVNNKGISIPGFERERKFYFSFDADLWRIKKLPRFLKVFTRTFGFIRIPFPALEFSKQGVSFKPLYF